MSILIINNSVIAVMTLHATMVCILIGTIQPKPQYCFWFLLDLMKNFFSVSKTCETSNQRICHVRFRFLMVATGFHLKSPLTIDTFTWLGDHVLYNYLTTDNDIPCTVATLIPCITIKSNCGAVNSSNSSDASSSRSSSKNTGWNLLIY